jgi:hypothetical protein
MMYQTADIQRHLFNISEDSAKSGILVNDLLQMHARVRTPNDFEIPKFYEQFKDLAAPSGLIVGCTDNGLHQSGGCIGAQPKIDEDIISIKLFDKLFENVARNSSHRGGSHMTKKRTNRATRNKTKRSWFS